MASLRSLQTGDTLIEVLISLAVLSSVIVGGNALMNLGMRNALTAVEHTLVRNQIVGQAELLRYLRDNAQPGGTDDVSEDWRNLLANNAYVKPDPASPIKTCNPGSNRDFYLKAEYVGQSVQPNITIEDYTGTPDPDDRPYAVPGDGLWIEAVESPPGTVQPYVDFHIRACWQGTGGSVDQRTNTVIRLYMQEPVAIPSLPSLASLGTLPLPTTSASSNCVKVVSTFSSDSSVMTTPPEQVQETLPFSTTLPAGCRYEVALTYGDTHAAQRAGCKGTPCESEQAEEWFYLEGKDSSGATVFRIPGTGHTPDIPDGPPGRFEYKATAETTSVVTSLVMVHPPLENPTGLDYMDQNSAHLYKYVFTPI